MQNDKLIQKIIKAQQGNEESWKELLKSFEPLLLKSATKLGYEDAFYDMQYEFVKIVQRIPVAKGGFENDNPVKDYIKKSIVHSCNRYRQRHYRINSHIVYFNEMSEEQESLIELIHSTLDDYFSAEFDSIRKCLTEFEFKTLYCIFILNLSVSDIADINNISRQAVNQSKLRALKKLSISYCA